MFVLEISILTLFTNDSCQWVLFGREPLEMFRLAACLWYMERRDLITSLYTVFRVMHMSFWYRYDLLHNIWLKLPCYSTMLFFILSVLCKNMSFKLTFSLAGCCTWPRAWCWSCSCYSEASGRYIEFWAQATTNYAYKGLKIARTTYIYFLSYIYVGVLRRIPLNCVRSSCNATSMYIF